MLLRRWRLIVAAATLAIGLIIWSSTLSPKRPLINLESIRINYWNVSVGQDSRGLPTALLRSKSTVVIKVTNADGFWGYSINGLMEMSIFLRQMATTTIERFYEPRKTTTKITVELRSDNIPLYGASPSVAFSEEGGFYLRFQAAFQTEAGFLPFMYKYTYTDVVDCQLSSVTVGANHSLAILSRKMCPRVLILS